MTIDEIIAVLQAARAGKIIQCRLAGSGEWDRGTVRMHGFWLFGEYDYRVKPEPREWVVRLGDYALYLDSSQAPGQEVIRVREVIE